MIYFFLVHLALSHKHFLNLAFSFITTITHPQLVDHPHLGNYLQFGEGKRVTNSKKILDLNSNGCPLIHISVLFQLCHIFPLTFQYFISKIRFFFHIS